MPPVARSDEAAAPFPQEIAARVAALAEAHKDLPFPDDASRAIALTRAKAAG